MTNKFALVYTRRNRRTSGLPPKDGVIENVPTDVLVELAVPPLQLVPIHGRRSARFRRPSFEPVVQHVPVEPVVQHVPVEPVVQYIPAELHVPRGGRSLRPRRTDFALLNEPVVQHVQVEPVVQYIPAELHVPRGGRSHRPRRTDFAPLVELLHSPTRARVRTARQHRISFQNVISYMQAAQARHPELPSASRVQIETKRMAEQFIDTANPKKARSSQIVGRKSQSVAGVLHTPEQLQAALRGNSEIASTSRVQRETKRRAEQFIDTTNHKKARTLQSIQTKSRGVARVPYTAEQLAIGSEFNRQRAIEMLREEDERARMAREVIHVAHRRVARAQLFEVERAVQRELDSANRRLARQREKLHQQERASQSQQWEWNADKLVTQESDSQSCSQSESQVYEAHLRSRRLAERAMESYRQRMSRVGLQPHHSIHEPLQGPTLEVLRPPHSIRRRLGGLRTRVLQSAARNLTVEMDECENEHASRPPSGSKVYAQHFRKSCQDIAWVYCPECQRSFLDVKLILGICKTCMKDKTEGQETFLYSDKNWMDPCLVPIELSRLSDLERILIARVHPMMSVYRIQGQQYKYSGNVINFAQDVNVIAQSLPVRPSDLSAILIVNRVGAHGSKEFRVRREFVRQALVWLKEHHIYYANLVIDDKAIESLPEDGIPDDIPHTQDNVVEAPTDQPALVPAAVNHSDGPPELFVEDVIIDEFQHAGTIAVVPQRNQQACIERVLLASDADHTTVMMPLSGNIINEFHTAGYISMVFPYLFPYGRADLRQARARKLSPSDYFQYLMKYKDGRFAKDSRFRYFAWNSISRWRALALGNVYVGKNPEDAELSIEDIEQLVRNGDKSFAKRVSYYSKSIRGTRSYWFTRLKELTAMVKQLGSPTIFFTLSAADMQWPELYKVLDPANILDGLPLAERMKGRAKLLNDNPLIVAWFLQERINLFFRQFLVPEFSVVDHWYRLEWQNRGSGHVHGFLWLQGSPDVTNIATSFEDRVKIIEYFDKLVCTMNPDGSQSNPTAEHPCARVLPPDFDPELDNCDYVSLVNWVMRHSRCGTYCLRLHKTTKQKVCRFKYPFDCSTQSSIVEDPPESNMYRFYGRRNDPLACSHNRTVLQTWRANIDWSPVLSVQSVVDYIGKYAAKSEPASKTFTDTLRGILQDILRPCQSAKSAIQRLFIKSVSERDISAQECCHLLMGYHLTDSSRKFVLLNITEKNMLSSTIRKRREGDAEDIEGTDPSFVIRYMQRPEELENVSLLDVAKRYYWKKGRWHKARQDVIVRVVPEFRGDLRPSSAEWEQFCRQQVLLKHHYRSPDDAIGGFGSWSERYFDLGLATNQSVTLPEPLDDAFEEDDELETDMVHQLDEWMVAAAMGPMFVPGEDVELGRRDIDTSHNWAEGLEKYPNIDSDKKFIHNCLRNNQESRNEISINPIAVPLDALSPEQRVAHDLVINSLINKTSIRLIVCGGAGTGKSTMINAIVHSATTTLGSPKAVRIMAPTGVAAFNVGGATIHHEFAINATRKGSHAYKHLVGEQCLRMQEDFKETSLIIIDEYSMLGRVMLANIDLRCRDIFAKNEPFGGVSIVLVGDMRQLPPVCDSALYAQHGSNIMQQSGGLAYTGFESCVRLNQVFRQVGHSQASFRDALGRLNNGTSVRGDWELFRTRDFSLFSTKEIEAFKHALRLFPTKAAANNYNRDRLIELGKPIARIPAKNNCKEASAASSDDAKGLQKELYLSVGARVMLRSNLSTHNGLVNGAMGFVEDIVYSPVPKSPNDIPVAVMVNFDQYRGTKFRPGTNIIPIPPQTTQWKTASGTSCQRTQIPLLLCWAITVHKSQGLTLDRAVIDIGDQESLRLTFVALSRTRRLSDLALDPMFTFERLEKIGTCSGLKGRLEEEKRPALMSTMNV